MNEADDEVADAADETAVEDAVLTVEVALAVAESDSSESESSQSFSSSLSSLSSSLSSSSSPVLVEFVDLVEFAVPPSAATCCSPGSCVMSVSGVPSAMGPSGFAAHAPSVASGPECPNGTVPFAPSVRPPTNVCSSALWNWHWKSPSSSEFFGAFWQYGVAWDVGCAPDEMRVSSCR